MNINELVAELKEVALKLNQVKHYVTKENLPIEDGMSPMIALMQDHARLDLRVRNLTTALTKVSEHNERMGHDIKEMAALLADINEYCQTNGIGTIGDSSSKALVMDHANLEKKVKSLTHSVMLVSQYNGRLETALKKAQADYIEANSDGETDCPTPYDVYVTVAEIKNVE